MAVIIIVIIVNYHYLEETECNGSFINYMHRMELVQDFNQWQTLKRQF
jgi:hypothetical protein